MATATAPGIPRELVQDRVDGFVNLDNGDPGPPMLALWDAIRVIIAAGLRCDPKYDFDSGGLVDELGDYVIARIVGAVTTGEVSREVEA